MKETTTKRASLTLADLSADGDETASPDVVQRPSAQSMQEPEGNSNEPSNFVAASTSVPPSTPSGERHLVNDWSATYGIFELWDADGSEGLSTDEVEFGIKLIFLNSKCPQLSYTAVSQILSGVRYDYSDNYILDRPAFGSFFFKLSKAANMPLEELAEICSRSILGGRRDHSSQGPCNSSCIDFSVSSNLSVEIKGFDKMHLLFDLIDLNNDGVLQANEISYAIEPLFDIMSLSTSTSDAKMGKQECMELMYGISGNDVRRCSAPSNGLNRHGFGVFLSRLSLVLGFSLEFITTSLLEDAQLRYAEHDEDVKELRKKSGIETEEYRVAYKHISELFDLWDADDSGTLDRSEISTVCQRLIDDENLTITFKEILHLFREVDDGDQELDVREFASFVLKLAELSGLPLDELVMLLMNHTREFQQEELNRSFLSREGNRLHNPLEDVVDMMRSFSSFVVGPTKEERLCHYLPFNASSKCDSDEERGIEPDFVESAPETCSAVVPKPLATKCIDNASDNLFGDLNSVSTPRTILPVSPTTIPGVARRAQAA